MGYIFFELLMGKHPDKIVSEEEKTIKQKLERKGVSNKVIEVIERCFEEQPDDRIDWPELVKESLFEENSAKLKSKPNQLSAGKSN